MRFHETLVLNWPALLPVTPWDASTTYIWFSTVHRDGREQIVCVTARERSGAPFKLLAHGTEALVSGTWFMNGLTLLVVASSVVATSSTPAVAAADTLPLFSSTLWPLCASHGVVSSPYLALSQPELAIANINIGTGESWVHPPIEIRCNPTPRTGDTSLATQGTVLISGAIVGVHGGHFLVAVRDVCQTSDAVGTGHSYTASVSTDSWLKPITPRIRVSLYSEHVFA